MTDLNNSKISEIMGIIKYDIRHITVGKLFLERARVEYFQLCMPRGLCHNYSALGLWHKAAVDTGVPVCQ